MASKPRFQRVRRIFSRGKDYSRDVVNADQIQDEWGNIKSMAGAVLKPKHGPVREETFDNAVSRLNLREADLAGAYKFHVVRVYIFTASLALGLISTLTFAFNGSWLATLACLGFCVAMGALFFQASFRSFQIFRRELVDISFWLENPGAWIPTSLVLPKPKRSGGNMVVKKGSSPRPRK